jgi:TIR domain
MSPSQTKPKPNFLRLVDTKSLADPISQDTFVRREWQSTLFANENPSLLLFVNLEEISESDFITILTGARPKFLFDLRKVPRFDIGGLNRKLAFSLFSREKIRYLDLSRQMKPDGEKGELDTTLAAKVIVDSSHNAFVEGPAAFLVDAQQFDERNISRLIEAMPSERPVPWDVLRVPVFDNRVQQASSRSIVFISHANPEDNAFATWLAGQLALAGYSVWSDVTQLVGGEVFWDDIESTIRLRAAKVIAVLSTSAQRKPNVLDELDLAIRVERSNGLSRFVLPVRLDDLSYSELRANIARKNVINFRNNGLPDYMHS